MNRLLLMGLRNFREAPGAYFKLHRYAKHAAEYSDEEKYSHIQYIFRKAIEAGNVELKAYGQENIPTENGFMIYANHQGLFDPLAIVTTSPQPFAAVVKKELHKIPFFKDIVDCTFSFPMNRENLRQSMKVINSVAEEIKKGRNYLIFPEGTRCRMGNKMLPFHGGSFKCAIKTKCPILPVALIDTYKVFDEKGCKQTEAQIHYLPAVTYDEYQGLSSTELAELVHSRIENKISEVTADRE